MRPLVSVIVPVYRVEDCLACCLDSLCRQSLHEIEIILVDDGSPDHCGEICDEYAAKDARFKVIHHTENKGLSAARNTGIANASSEYLMFVDSDDWVDDDFCRLSYECALEKQADLVMFRFRYVERDISFGNNKKTNKNAETPSLLKSGYKTTIEALDLMNCSDIGVTAWNKLYHKKVFNSIFYPIGYLFEDLGTTYKTILQASCIFYLDIVLYYKCEYINSITTKKTEKALHDWFEMYMRQYCDLMAWGGYSAEKLDCFLINNAMTYCIRKRRNLLDDYYVFCSNKLLSCKRIPYNFTWRRKVMLMVFKYCQPLFEIICTVFGRKYDE